MNLISVLLPIYNATPWLSDCIESILAQTANNWELLAIDDFSEDDTWRILEKYAAKDPRIKIYKNVEKGIIPALRLAFAKSEGEFITRMDADDLMPPNKLESLQNILLAKGAGHLSTGLVRYFSDGELQEGYRKYADWLNQLTLLERNYEEIYKECVIPSPCWMLHRTDLIKCGAFDANTYPEDYDLCFRFYKNDIKIAASNTVLHEWRDHATRTSRTDEHYSNQAFFDLKLDYFLALEYYHSRPLVIWGAGKKGKLLAQKLRHRDIPFMWVCNNPNKWGKEIQGVCLQNYKSLPTIWQPQILVSVAAPDGKKEIQQFLDLHQYERNYHYFFLV